MKLKIRLKARKRVLVRKILGSSDPQRINVRLIIKPTTA